MKSKFAKFVDSTLGAILIFAAATAIMRYYTTLELAAFCGMAITACTVLLLRITGKRKTDAQKLSRAADDMFFDFMFTDARTQAKLLYSGLKEKTQNVAIHGNGVYLGNTAAFCCFDRSPDEKALASYISKAKHFGAKKILVLCRSVGNANIDVADFSVKLIGGDDVYRLFASLDALPESKFKHKHRTRRAAFAGALGKDKIARYILLAVGFFAVSTLLGTNTVMFVCACVCAALAVASIIVNIAKKLKVKE